MSRWINEDRLLLELSDLMDEFSELDERGLHNDRWCGIMDSKQVIINAPGIELCDDTISRKSVLAAIGKRVEKLQADRDKGATSRAIDLGGIIPLINDIPSVAPSRPVGKWLKSEIVETWVGALDKNTPNTFQSHKCSNCGFKTGTWMPNYCPNCGARMKGADDETEMF